MPELLECEAQQYVLRLFIGHFPPGTICMKGLWTDPTTKERPREPKTSRLGRDMIDEVPEGCRKYIRGTNRVWPVWTPGSWPIKADDLKTLFLWDVIILNRRELVFDFGWLYLKVHLRTHTLAQILTESQFMNSLHTVRSKLRYKVPLAICVATPEGLYFLTFTSMDALIDIQWIPGGKQRPKAVKEAGQMTLTQCGVITKEHFTSLASLATRPDPIDDPGDYTANFVDTLMWRVETPTFVQGFVRAAKGLKQGKLPFFPDLVSYSTATLHAKSIGIKRTITRVEAVKILSDPTSGVGDDSDEESEPDPLPGDGTDDDDDDTAEDPGGVTLLDAEPLMGDDGILIEVIDAPAEWVVARGLAESTQLIYRVIMEREDMFPGIGMYSTSEILFWGGVSGALMAKDVFSNHPLEGFLVAIESDRRVDFSKCLRVFGKKRVIVPPRMKELWEYVEKAREEKAKELDVFEPSFLKTVLTLAQVPGSKYAWLGPLIFGLSEWRRLTNNPAAEYGKDDLTKFFAARGLLDKPTNLPVYETLFVDWTNKVKGQSSRIDVNVFGHKGKLWSIATHLPDNLSAKQVTRMAMRKQSEVASFREIVTSSNQVMVGPTDYVGVAERVKKPTEKSTQPRRIKPKPRKTVDTDATGDNNTAGDDADAGEDGDQYAGTIANAAKGPDTDDLSGAGGGLYIPYYLVLHWNDPMAPTHVLDQLGGRFYRRSVTAKVYRERSRKKSSKSRSTRSSSRASAMKGIEIEARRTRSRSASANSANDTSEKGGDFASDEGNYTVKKEATIPAAKETTKPLLAATTTTIWHRTAHPQA